jgi:hypothetical protein
VTVLCAEDVLVVVFPDVQVGERLVPGVHAVRVGRVQRARHVILL